MSKGWMVGVVTPMAESDHSMNVLLYSSLQYRSFTVSYHHELGKKALAHAYGLDNAFTYFYLLTCFVLLIDQIITHNYEKSFQEKKVLFF